MKKVHHYVLPLAAAVIVLVVGYVVLFSGAEPLHDGTGSTNSTITGFSGDVNGDGKVDGADLSIVSAAYGTTATTKTPADINDDSVVNVLDVSIVANAMPQH